MQRQGFSESANRLALDGKSGFKIGRLGHGIFGACQAAGKGDRAKAQARSGWAGGPLAPGKPVPGQRAGGKPQKKKPEAPAQKSASGEPAEKPGTGGAGTKADFFRGSPKPGVFGGPQAV